MKEYYLKWSGSYIQTEQNFVEQDYRINAIKIEDAKTNQVKLTIQYDGSGNELLEVCFGEETIILTVSENTFVGEFALDKFETHALTTNILSWDDWSKTFIVANQAKKIDTQPFALEFYDKKGSSSGLWMQWLQGDSRWKISQKSDIGSGNFGLDKLFYETIARQGETFSYYRVVSSSEVIEGSQPEQSILFDDIETLKGFRIASIPSL